MGDDAVPEIGEPLALFRAVKKLVNHHNVRWLVFFLERADGADADNVRDSEFFQAVNIGAMVEFAREDSMAAAVAGEKDNFVAGKFTG